jgi:hypothetical protein
VLDRVHKPSNPQRNTASSEALKKEVARAGEYHHVTHVERDKVQCGSIDIKMRFVGPVPISRKEDEGLRDEETLVDDYIHNNAGSIQNG